MQELWFLCMTRRLNVLYNCMKFRRNICNGYQVIERTRFVTDRQTDPQTHRPTDTQTHRHTDARGKTICLPTLAGGRHNEIRIETFPYTRLKRYDGSITTRGILQGKSMIRRKWKVYSHFLPWFLVTGL